MTVTDTESEPSLPSTPSPSNLPTTERHRPSRQVQIKSEPDMPAAAPSASGASGENGLPPKNPNNTNNNTHQNGEVSKRTLQNRRAQREFRERRASYVKSLENRIRQFERNEIQGNVELQRAARRLKEENDSLRELLRQTHEQLAIYAAQAPVPLSQNRTPAQGRRSGAPQAEQPPQSFYTHAQGFSNDVAAYDVVGPAPSFQTNNPQGYPQYFPQQVILQSKTFVDRDSNIMMPTPQHPQGMYLQDRSSDPSLNPDQRWTPGGSNENLPSPTPTTIALIFWIMLGTRSGIN